MGCRERARGCCTVVTKSTLTRRIEITRHQHYRLITSISNVLAMFVSDYHYSDLLSNIISMIMFQLFSSTHVLCSLPSADSRSPFCLFRACLRLQVPYSKEIGWGKCHGKVSAARQLVSLVLFYSLLDGCLVPLSGSCVICNVPCIIRRRTALM